MAYWIEVNDERERQVYVIDLDRVAAFSLSWNNRLTIFLPNSDRQLILTPQSEPEAYRRVLDYVEKTTGYSLEKTRSS